MSFGNPQRQAGFLPQYEVRATHPNGTEVKLTLGGIGFGVNETLADPAFIAARDALTVAGFTLSTPTTKRYMTEETSP